MDQELRIKIATEANTAGATQTEQALARVADSSKKANIETKGLNGALGDLAGRGSGARDALDGLNQASTGGISSVLGLAKAFRGLKDLLSAANPFTLLITGLTVLVSLGSVLYEKFFKPTQSEFQKLQERSKLAADGINSVNLTKLEFDRQKTALDQLTNKFEKARAAADALYQAEQRLDSAKFAGQLAKLGSAEQQELLAAGDDEDRKKAISLKYDADRAALQAAHDAAKNSADIAAKEKQLDSIKTQQIATAKQEQAVEAVPEKTIADFEAAKKAAAQVGLKSDQEQAQEDLKTANDRAELERQLAEGVARSGGYISPASVASARKLGVDAKTLSLVDEKEKLAAKAKADLAAGITTYNEAPKLGSDLLADAQRAYNRNRTPENAKKLVEAQSASDIGQQLPVQAKAAADAVLTLQDLRQKAADAAGQLDLLAKTVAIDLATLKQNAANSTVTNATAETKIAGDTAAFQKSRITAAAASAGGYDSDISAAQAAIASIQQKYKPGQNLDELHALDQQLNAAKANLQNLQDKKSAASAAYELYGPNDPPKPNLAPSTLNPYQSAAPVQQAFGQFQQSQDNLSSAVVDGLKTSTDKNKRTERQIRTATEAGQ